MIEDELTEHLHNNDSFAKVKVSASLILALAKPHLSDLRAFARESFSLPSPRLSVSAREFCL